MWCALLDYVIRLGGSDGADSDRDARWDIVVVAYAFVE